MRPAIPPDLKNAYARAYLRLQQWTPGSAADAHRRNQLLAAGYALGQVVAVGGGVPAGLASWVSGALGVNMNAGAQGVTAAMRSWVNAADGLMDGTPHLGGLTAPTGSWLPYLVLAAVAFVVMFSDDEGADETETEEQEHAAAA